MSSLSTLEGAHPVQHPRPNTPFHYRPWAHKITHSVTGVLFCLVLFIFSLAAHVLLFLSTKPSTLFSSSHPSPIVCLAEQKQGHICRSIFIFETRSAQFGDERMPMPVPS